MAATASGSVRAVARQAWADLQPFPGRLALTWRVALLCALVAGVAMLYRIPESAIGCYLVLFLARPNGAECVVQAIGIIVLASILVLALAPVIQATADSALLRMAVIGGVSIALVFLGAASQLGEQASCVALVVAFVLTLVDQVPSAQIVTRGLLYAWQMACVPMAMIIAFNLVLGISPHRLLRDTVRARLEAAALALEAHGAEAGAALHAALAEGNAEVGKRSLLAALFHTAPAATVIWLRGAAMTSYRLLLVVAALPASGPDAGRAALAQRCRAAAASIRQGGRPEMLPTGTSAGAYDSIGTALDGLARDDGGTTATLPRQPFFAPDIFTNPDHQRYALKVTAAAITCYIAYSIINWPGIHTAMITCYVAALGTTAETIHKLALRIAGCLVGASMAFASILFVIPHLQSVGGLMALVFAATLAAAWVSSGSERISYAGVQIGLAFLLVVLNGFSPSLDMSSGRDRIVGILLGNTVVYLFFTGLWPRSAAIEVKDRLRRIIEALATLASFDAAARPAALAEADTIETAAAAVQEQLRLLHLEPVRQRPSPEWLDAAAGLVGDARGLLPQLMFSARLPASAAPRLRAAASAIGGPGGRAVDAVAGPDIPTAPETGPGIARIERWASTLGRVAGLLLPVLLAACSLPATHPASADPTLPWRPAMAAVADERAGRNDALNARDFGVPPQPGISLPPADADLSQGRIYGLAGLIDIAQTRNPLTRTAWQQARQAVLAAGAVEATFLPQVSANVIGGWQRVTRRQSLPLGESVGFSSSVSGISPQIALQWLLFDFGQRSALYDAARNNADAANILFNGVHQKIIHDVTRAYFLYGAGRSRVRLAEQNLANSTRVAAAASARNDKGLGTTVELAQARQAVAQARLGLVQSQGAERDLYQGLLGAMGVSPMARLRVDDSGGRRLPTDLGRPTEELIAAALARRPDVLAAFSALKASRAGIAAAQAEFLPKLYLGAVAAAGTNDLNAAGLPTIGQQSASTGIVLGATMPLFDGGLRQARLRTAQSLADATQATFQRTRDAAAREIVVSADTLRSALASYAAARSLAAASAVTYDAAFDAYKAGIGTVTVATIADSGLLTARQAEVDAHTASLVAAANLAFLLGSMTSADAASAVGQ